MATSTVSCTEKIKEEKRAAGTKALDRGKDAVPGEISRFPPIPAGGHQRMRGAVGKSQKGKDRDTRICQRGRAEAGQLGVHMWFSRDLKRSRGRKHGNEGAKRKGERVP